MPGREMQMTEGLPQAAVREVWKETRYEVEVTGLVGTYTDARHVIAYSNGEMAHSLTLFGNERK